MSATIAPASPVAPGNSKISGMTAVTLKGLWANKSRFGLSSLAVIISVAFLTAMLILTNAISGTATDDVAAANSGIDAVVLGEQLGTADAGPGGESAFRAEVPVATVDTVQAIDGVNDAVGIRSGAAQLLAQDGSQITTGTRQTIGETWVSEPALSTFQIVDGTEPIDGIVIDQFTANETGLAVGDSVKVLTNVAIVDATIDGIATYGAADNAPDTSTVLFAADTDLLGTGGYTRIVVDTDLDAAALQGAVGSSVVESGAAYVADLQDQIETQLTFQTTFLLAFAIIALIAGTTIIYNTFVIAVAQRTRELALLRSIGASRSQVLKSVMSEAAVIGVLASIVGALVGVGSAYALLAFFDWLGLPILSGSLPVTASSLVLGGMVGLVVTLLSAFVPARKAANTPPVAALRDAAVDPSGVSRIRTGVAAALLAGGTIAGVAGAVDGTWEIAVGGVLSVFVGVIVGGPMIAGWVSRVGGVPLGAIGGTVGRLASTNAARNPRRSASTALALTLGVTLMAFFTVIASSIGNAAASDTEAALQADQVVTPYATIGGPDDITYLPSTLATDIEANAGTGSGIEIVAPLSSASVVADGTVAFAAGTDVSNFDEVYDLSVSSGSLDDVAGTSIAVHADAADGAAVGDTLSLAFPRSGEVTVTVAAIYDTNLPGQFPAQYLFDETEFAALAPSAGDALVFVSTDGSDAAVAALTSAVDDAGGAVVQTGEEYVDSLGSAIDGFRNFVYALLGVAVIIAIVGIANTTVMAVRERTKEIGMLRSVGMTAPQVRRMIRNEALLLSVQGSVVGLLLGVGSVYAVFAALAGDELTLTLPLASLAIIGIGGAISGVAAAAWPAWRASRMAPLEAMASI